MGLKGAAGTDLDLFDLAERLFLAPGDDHSGVAVIHSGGLRKFYQFCWCLQRREQFLDTRLGEFGEVLLLPRAALVPCTAAQILIGWNVQVYMSRGSEGEVARMQQMWLPAAGCPRQRKKRTDKRTSGHRGMREGVHT